MRCGVCFSGFTNQDDVHVTEGKSPMYLHTFCVGDNKIDHLIPAKVKGENRLKQYNCLRDVEAFRNTGAVPSYVLQFVSLY